MEYRVENKYYISALQLALLQERLDTIMDRDAYSQEGPYSIRSAYFDDLWDTCLQENEAGISGRSKYRLRIYNASDQMIKLEEKQSKNSYKKKIVQTVTKEAANRYLSWQDSFDRSDHSPDNALEKKLLASHLSRGLKPKVIVEYERMAYVDPRGNVRITLDQNIGACSGINQFWNPNIETIPLLPTGRHILEMKYDEILPEYIKKECNLGRLQKVSYSKYYQARQNPMLG